MTSHQILFSKTFHSFFHLSKHFCIFFQLIPLSLNLVCRCLTYKSFVRKHPLCSLDLLIQSVFLFFQSLKLLLKINQIFQRKYQSSKIWFCTVP